MSTNVSNDKGGRNEEPSQVVTRPPAPGSMGRPLDRLTPAALDVLAERRRQVEVEGFTTEVDDQWTSQQMAQAAASYALTAAELIDSALEVWPYQWDRAWFKPTDPRRDLVKAGALILAEIGRLDRAETKETSS